MPDPIQLQDPAALEALRASTPLLAVYLKSDSCAPCHAVLPVVKAQLLAPTDAGAPSPWRLAVVEQSEAPELFGQLLVFTVPALVLYIHGQEFKRWSRFIRAQDLVEARARAEQLSG